MIKKRITKRYSKKLDLGINFFDTAEFYGDNKTELILGKLLKNANIQREEIVICTKIFKGNEKKGLINNCGLSRKHIIEGLKSSLLRLGLDYVDVVLAYRPDNSTPIEETCRAFNWLIEKGYAFYWGNI